MVFCKNCNAQLDDSEQVCRYCNTPVTPDAPAVAVFLARNLLAFVPIILFLYGAARLSKVPFRLMLKGLRPLRFMDWNHLAVRSAAAVIADRIVGDFW